MKRIDPLDPWAKEWNIREREVAKVVFQTPEAVNQHAEELERLSKENKELKEQLKKLEKVIEVLQAQINEIKEDKELIAQIQQAPPAYKN